MLAFHEAPSFLKKKLDQVALKDLDPNRLAEQTIRRLCRKNPKTGKAKVSDEIAKQFFAGGSKRDDLIRMFYKAGGTRESRLEKIDVYICFDTHTYIYTPGLVFGRPTYPLI